MKFSKYKTHAAKDNITIDINKYVDLVRNGEHQSLIFEARANKNNEKKYKAIKSKLPAITGSCTMRQNKRSVDNIAEMNGLILLDIDENVSAIQRKEIDNDKYTFCSNRSVGDDGLVVFVKINPNKFLESFYGLAQYYSDNFQLDIDPSCKDKGRLRYISYDRDIYVNEDAKKFIAKSLPKKKKKKETFFFHKDDFTHIIDQIQEKQIDLCEDDYQRFTEIGFAIGSEFGFNGLEYFKAICQIGSKYEPDRVEKQYEKFCQQGSITISTFYYYAKKAGCDLYSEKSKTIIKRVAVGKANKSKITPQSIIDNVKLLSPDVEISEDDKPFIENLIKSNENLANKIEDEENETVRLEKFIKENYPISKNSFNQEYELKGKTISDETINSITIHAKKYFDFKVNSGDVNQLIFNEETKTHNPIANYFKENNEDISGEEIIEYAELIKPYNSFNAWALTKWLVGAIHNWTSPEEHEEVSPLVLVLCGKQASGKTSFFRNMLPKNLREYFIDEAMDEGGKDVLKRMATSMMMLNDEFGGMAAKDVKNFKKITEKNKITLRLPYGKLDVTLKRRTMLCGTTNDKAVLKDETGNRRVLPLQFEGVDYEAAKEFDKNKLLKCAYELYKSGFDFRIFSKEDMKYLNENTSHNIEIEASEDLFFTKFSFTQNDEFSEKIIMNQGEICNFMNIHFEVNISKYDIRKLCLKYGLELKPHRYKGKVVMGYKMFKEPEFP
jgi:predicted P-loop ATPase